jgi:hypothetical protein
VGCLKFYKNENIINIFITHQTIKRKMTLTVNPFTNRLIKVGGPTYQKIVSDPDFAKNLGFLRCSPRNKGENWVIPDSSCSNISAIYGTQYVHENVCYDKVRKVTLFWPNIFSKCSSQKMVEFNDLYVEKSRMIDYAKKDSTYQLTVAYNEYVMCFIDEAWAT